MAANEKVSTGSLGEKLILRTTRRGSVRETLSKAIRNTLKRSSSNERGKSLTDLPKFGTALTAMTTRSSEERSSESDNKESPSRIYFKSKVNNNMSPNNTSRSSSGCYSSCSPRSSSSTRRNRLHTNTSSSSIGFGSLSHLPPIQKPRKHSDSFISSSCLMSQSMYADASSNWMIPSSPSLTTLKDFEMNGEYDDGLEEEEEEDLEDGDVEFDDVKSVISSASTSRLFSLDRKPRYFKQQQSLRQFLNSPVRLRKRVDPRHDAVEAGFEPARGSRPENVLRCNSTQSLRDVQRTKSYSNSQFLASDLSLNPNGRVVSAKCDSTTTGGGTSTAAPTAVINPNFSTPARQKVLKPTHSRSSYDYQEDLRHLEHAALHQQQQQNRRCSLQPLTASSLYHLTNGRVSSSQFLANPQSSSAERTTTSRQRVSSVNQIHLDSQRRSVHNIHDQFGDFESSVSSNPKKVAVAPLTHKSRHLSESRDEIQRRGSGSMNLPAYQSYLMRQQQQQHQGEERLVDGPIRNGNDARIAYLEQRIRDLEIAKNEARQQQQQQQQQQHTPQQSRHSRSSPFTNSPSLMSEQIKIQEMNEELMHKEKQVTQLESKLLKAYQKMERLNEENEMKIRTVIHEGEQTKMDLSRCLEKLQHLEDELVDTRESIETNDQETTKNLRNQLWKQDRELQESRVLLSRLKEKESEMESIKSEMAFLQIQNETLNKKLEAKVKDVKALESNTLRLEEVIYQQSCSSGSTPLAEESDPMCDIRPSMAKPYTKAHSTLGSGPASAGLNGPSKVSGLTKSFSNFAINSTSKRDDVTPLMSRTIREQNRHISMCRGMAVCMKDALLKLKNDGNLDVSRLLGVRINVMSESEMDDEEEEAEESTPFSMMAAESVLTKQCQKLAELDKDLEAMRCEIINWKNDERSSSMYEGEGDRETCRLQ